MYEIQKHTVTATNGTFEEHPESYRPRVFALVVNPYGSEHKTYEILSNGQAMWPALPPDCPFDYWKVSVDSLACLKMVRSNQLLTAPTIPQEAWDALREAESLNEMDAPNWFTEWENSLPSKYEESSRLAISFVKDHLPEGSH